ncbi:MAG: U32 family peptidase [Prevotella sp.]|nr:U32 family peptidase [Prevotella sp.]
MTSLELLSPAKNLAYGMAAIDHGADAVYIGAARFGARAAAGNSVEDIRELCNYAHRFGAKVYVTVNTIVYNEELEATRQLLAELAAAGADAILIQDMAVLRMLNEQNVLSAKSSSSLPLLRAHASTQTDNRTAKKVGWLRQQGFSRVVLARELSAAEIADIHRQHPDVELEVFVHGALCVSYSGLCYASEHCFGRSANRGACAQFCRMKFSLLDADDNVIEKDRYLLSLKDMNQSARLDDLIAAGACSFKIEGRLKDLSYVKNVTAYYSERLNEIVRQHPDKYCRSSLGRCVYTFRPDLSKTFNRGYTHYFLDGRRPDIASFDTPKAMGEFVGVVKEIRGDSFNVAGTTAFANGDGLCFIDGEQTLQGFRANRVSGNRIWPRIMPSQLKPGTRLYRNNDQELERVLSRQSATRLIPITLSLRATDSGYSLSASLVETRRQVNPLQVFVEMDCEHQLAQKPPFENLCRQLTKFGDTIYSCENVDIPADFAYFIPNSLLADMRRELVSRLDETILSQAASARMDVKGSAVSQSREANSVTAPAYDYPYEQNISNELSRQFYGAKELSAYELKGGEGPVMQCRHCLRYSLGYCVKNGGRKPTWREPLRLRLGDGREFRLAFDCQRCQMNVFASCRK